MTCHICGRAVCVDEMGPLCECAEEADAILARVAELEAQNSQSIELLTAISIERDRYRETLETLYAVVGLTAVKHESQGAVLQEAMDKAAAVLYPKL